MRLLEFGFILAGAAIASAQSYQISTIAGGGGGAKVGALAAGSSGGDPCGIAVDAAGNVYRSGRYSGQVLVIDPSGTITGVIGTGTYGFSGDGGRAELAELASPCGVAVDVDGNIFIADTGNSRIRKVSGGIITTVAGNQKTGFGGDGGNATDSSLSYPLGVAVDAGGNLYITDTSNHRIRKVADGIITTIAGSGNPNFSGDGGSATNAQISAPFGIALVADGTIYFGDSGNKRVRKISNGTITTIAGNGGSVSSGDGGPAISAGVYAYGVAADENANVFVADWQNNRIRRISNGAITTVAGDGIGGYSGDGGNVVNARLAQPTAVALDNLGNLYVADTGNSRIRKISGGVITTFAGNGEGNYSGDGTAATNADLFYPESLALDSGGKLYIADSYNNRIRMISDGVITTVAGNGAPGFSGDGGAATNASIFSPYGIALDSKGTLYIADTVNNRVRKVSGGIITTVVGNGTRGFSGDGGPATDASLSSPVALAFDVDDNLYIGESRNLRIRKVSAGIITTIAGTGRPGFNGDGVSATSANVYPYGLAINSAGDLYIADIGSNRIRKISGGVITTVAGGGFGGDGGSATSASLNGPFGITLDSSGSFYIADEGNNRIRKVTGGVIRTIAGNGNYGFSGDGGNNAKVAGLSFPQAMVVDPSGNVIITDTQNQRIRMLTPKSTSAPDGTIAADPPLIIDPSGARFTTLSWTTANVTAVEIRIGSPDGKLFAWADPSGSLETGNWVTDGMTFYLQDASKGNTTDFTNTLAVVSVSVNPKGFLSARSTAAGVESKKEKR